MQPSDRLHALDALRAYALLLGILLHAATPWLQDVDVWPIKEAPADTLAVVWYVIHMFRMPVFFLIAGFFGRMILERRGIQAFVKDRGTRIVLPFVVGLPAVMVLMSLMYLAGFLVTGRSVSELMASVQGSQEVQPTSRQSGPSPAHLWFLYYLIMLYAGMLTLRWVVRLIDKAESAMSAIDTGVRLLMKGVWAPLLLGIPLAVYFLDQSDWSSWTGLSAPRSFVPNGSLLGYAVFFGLGWLLHRQRELLLRLEKTWHVNCALAVVLTLVCLKSGGIRPHWQAYMHGADLKFYAVAYLVGVWFWAFGLIGAALRFLSAESPVRRYLADSSYWLYILHLPLLLFFHVLFQATQWHWAVEYLLSLVGVIPILLLTYHYWVRSTFIGATLNGRRIPRRCIVAP